MSSRTGNEPRLILKVQAEHAQSLAISSDGKTVAVAVGKESKPGGRTVVRLWDVASGKNTATLEAGSSKEWSLAFSPDSKTLAAAVHGGPVKVWDVATGKSTATLNGGAAWVGRPAFGPGLAFSPDGKTLAWGGGPSDRDSDPGAVQLWDVTTGKRTVTLQGQSVLVCVAFSPDGKVLASGGANPSVMLWDVKAGKSTASLDGHPDQGCFSKFFAMVFSLAFSPDGKVLASASFDGTINLWDPATGRQLATLGDKRFGVLCVAFSPDGKTLASAGLEERPGTAPGVRTSTGVLRLWDVPTGKCLAAFRDLDEVVVWAAFSPEGKVLLASGGQDGTIRLWDLPPTKRAGQ